VINRPYEDLPGMVASGIFRGGLNRCAGGALPGTVSREDAQGGEGRGSVYLVMIVPEAVHGTGMEVPEWFHEDTRQMPHGECIDGESPPGMR
jgi:hypothetical protein